MIWTFGSGYGGNALLGKKCYALRIASVMARDEGWLAEHMLILKLTSPERQVQVHRGGVPERLRQDQPRHARARPSRAGRSRPSATTSPGCGSARTAGCMRSTPSSASSASPPAPTSTPTPTPCGPSTRATRSSPTSRSPTTATSGGRAWRTPRPTPPAGRASTGRPTATSCPATPTAATAPRSSSARSSPTSTTTRKGVPIDAIFFGGRRKTTVPLVTESRDWIHGTFMGATLSSETTAAAAGAVGVVRRDPMAMLPFIGYNAGDYFSHWVNLGKDARRRQAAEDLLRQLVPPRRRRRLPVAGLRREQPRPQVGHRAHRGQGRRGRDPDRPRADARSRSTPTAST